MFIYHPKSWPLCWWVCRIQPLHISAVSIGALINFVDWLNLFFINEINEVNPQFRESTKTLFFRPFEQIPSNGLLLPFYSGWLLSQNNSWVAFHIMGLSPFFVDKTRSPKPAILVPHILRGVCVAACSAGSRGPKEPSADVIGMRAIGLGSSENSLPKFDCESMLIVTIPIRIAVLDIVGGMPSFQTKPGMNGIIAGKIIGIMA